MQCSFDTNYFLCQGKTGQEGNQTQPSAVASSIQQLSLSQSTNSHMQPKRLSKFGSQKLFQSQVALPTSQSSSASSELENSAKSEPASIQAQASSGELPKPKSPNLHKFLSELKNTIKKSASLSGQTWIKSQRPDSHTPSDTHTVHSVFSVQSSSPCCSQNLPVIESPVASSESHIPHNKVPEPTVFLQQASSVESEPPNRSQSQVAQSSSESQIPFAPVPETMVVFQPITTSQKQAQKVFNSRPKPKITKRSSSLRRTFGASQTEITHQPNVTQPPSLTSFHDKSSGLVLPPQPKVCDTSC